MAAWKPIIPPCPGKGPWLISWPPAGVWRTDCNLVFRFLGTWLFFVLFCFLTESFNSHVPRKTASTFLTYYRRGGAANRVLFNFWVSWAHNVYQFCLIVLSQKTLAKHLAVGVPEGPRLCMSICCLTEGSTESAFTRRVNMQFYHENSKHSQLFSVKFKEDLVS